MYYRKALKLQAFLDMAEDDGMFLLRLFHTFKHVEKLIHIMGYVFQIFFKIMMQLTGQTIHYQLNLMH